MSDPNQKAFELEMRLVPVFWAGLIGYWTWRAIMAFVAFYTGQ